MGLTFVVKTNKFPQASALMRKAIGVAFARSGQTILNDMKTRTPVDTGLLRASETVETSETEMRFAARTDYALYVHEGTRRMAGRPFMREAIEAGIPTIENELAAAINGEFG